TATPVSGTQITLAWDTSTDNVGVSNYLVERQDSVGANFLQIGTTTGLTYTDPGLSSRLPSPYPVRAPNPPTTLNPYTTVIQVTTLDSVAPSTPGNLGASAVSATQIALSWTTSIDNVAVVNYLIERQDPGSTSFVQIGTSNVASFSDTGLLSGASYQ